MRRGLQQASAFVSSGGHESDMSIALAPASADNMLELKAQESIVRGHVGWSQQSSKNSRSLTLCYAGPPLPPRQMGVALTAPEPVYLIDGRINTRGHIVIEMFLDFVCPFSCKMFKTVQDGVIPKFGASVSFIVHQVIQPWHPHGAWVHEVCLCVGTEFPSKYATYVRKVIEAFEGGAF